MNEKGKEKKENIRPPILVRMLVLSEVEIEYNCDSPSALFVEIIRNSCGNCKPASMAAEFKLLVPQ